MALAPRSVTALLTVALGLWIRPGAAQTIVPVISGVPDPTAVAIDGSDNLFLLAGSELREYLAADGYKTFSTLNSGVTDPGGITVDGAGDVFVSDLRNGVIVELPAAQGYGTVETIATGFDLPDWLALDAAGNIFVSDSYNSVKEVLASSGYKTTKTLNSGFYYPRGLAVDANENVFVAIPVGAALQEITAADNYGTIKFVAYPSVVPQDVAIDRSGNVYFTDTQNSAVTELTAASDYASSIVLGNSFGAPYGIAIDSHGNIFVADEGYGGIKEILGSPPSTLAAVLPGARSVALGHTATVFASVINTAPDALGGCGIALPASAPAGLTLDYQTTDPAANTPTGSPNTPVTIPGNGGSQSFVVSFQGSQAFSAEAMPLTFGCAGATPAAVVPGVDTVDLTFSNTAVPDIITAIQTPMEDGIMVLPSGTRAAPGAGAFAVASTNHGAAGPITVSFDTGSAYLPLQGSICQTNPVTGQCLAALAPTLTLDYAAGAIETFSVFLQSLGPITFQPASSRIFVRFADSGGVIHGSVSVAVKTVN